MATPGRAGELAGRRNGLLQPVERLANTRGQAVAQTLGAAAHVLPQLLRASAGVVGQALGVPSAARVQAGTAQQNEK